MKYRNVLPNHIAANMRALTVHLHGVDLIDMQIHDWLYKRIFIWKNADMVRMLLVRDAEH